jgi:hypothetical protein
MSADFFASSMLVRPTFRFSLIGFDYGRFLRSVCQISYRYLESLAGGNFDFILSDLLRNCFAFCTHIFVLPEVRESFAGIEASLLLKAFTISSQSTTIFHPSSPFVDEAISFLYMSLISNPKFLDLVASSGYSNHFIYHLLFTGQLVYEKIGSCYTHSVLLSILIALVNLQTVAEKLNEPFREPFGSLFKVESGSYADLLLNILLNICTDSQFSPSIVLVFDMIAPHLTDLSIATAGRLLSLLHTISVTQKRLVPLLLEGIADTLHSHFTGFSVAITHETMFFRNLRVGDPRSEKALAAIYAYLVAAARVIMESNKEKLTNSELMIVLESIQLSERVEVREKRHPNKFEGELEKRWGEWKDLLFIRTFREEIQKMQVFRESYGGTLREKLQL